MYKEKSGFSTFLIVWGILCIVFSVIGGLLIAGALDYSFGDAGVLIGLTIGSDGIIFGVALIGGGLALQYLHEIRNFTFMEKKNTAEIIELLKKNNNNNNVVITANNKVIKTVEEELPEI